MFKKFLLQALVLVAFAALAIASSKEAQDSYRAGWEATSKFIEDME